MAKGRKTGGKDWLKGKPGGPGRKPLLPEIKDLPAFDKPTFNRYLNEAVNATDEESRIVINDSEAPRIRKWLHAICIKGNREGDMSKLDALLNRAIGKVKEEVSIGGSNGNAIELVIKDYRSRDNSD